MKKHIITVTGLCVVLLSNTITYSEDKKQTTTTTVTDPMTNRSFAATDISSDLSIAFVDSFAIMGECQEGQLARKDIENKRDLAAQEIQEESKVFEKAKNDYIAKSTTMSDSAREKEEKRLMKMERELKTIVAEKEEELKQEMHVATENLAQSLEAGVNQLAKAQNLDVVFDKMTGRAIYVSTEFDFTEKAIKEVNKKYEVKLAQNKEAEKALKLAENKTSAAKPAKVGA